MSITSYKFFPSNQLTNSIFSVLRYGIAPRLLEAGAKPRIEVFNPCDDSDDQKTSTAILFTDGGEFIAFGTNALQRYAEMLDDEETGMLFQTYKLHLLHMDANALSLDGRELPLMKVISESLRFIGAKAMEKLSEQVGKIVKTKIRWVITVPALWSEEHKFFMRKAAQEAGIIDD